MRMEYNRDIISYIVAVIAILTVVDTITTLYGLSVDLPETNVITISFMKMFGDSEGVIVSCIAKIVLVPIAYFICVYLRNHEEIKNRDNVLNVVNKVTFLGFLLFMAVTLGAVLNNFILILMVHDGII